MRPSPVFLLLVLACCTSSGAVPASSGNAHAPDASASPSGDASAATQATSTTRTPTLRPQVTPDSAAPSATVSVSGTVDGVAFTAKDALAVYSTLTGSILSGTTGHVAITDFADACRTASKSQEIAGTVVQLTLSTQASGSVAPPVEAGTYKVPTNPRRGLSASVGLETADTTGEVKRKLSATGGSLTITVATPSRIAGSFDVTFEHGSLKGTFDAPVCLGLR